jgi:hypothetical protein
VVDEREREKQTHKTKAEGEREKRNKKNKEEEEREPKRYKPSSRCFRSCCCCCCWAPSLILYLGNKFKYYSKKKWNGGVYAVVVSLDLFQPSTRQKRQK